MKKAQKEKGSFGYIEWRKKKNLFATLLMFGIAAAVFLLGLFLNKFEKNNIFSIIAALITLPAAKRLVSYFLFFPYHSVSVEKYNKILPLIQNEDVFYTDLLITSPEKVMHLSFLVYTGAEIIGLIGREKESEKYISKYFIDSLKKNGRPTVVHIERKEDVFLKKVIAAKRIAWTPATQEEVVDQEEVLNFIRSLMA